jgi:hypothetical protein
MGSRAIRFLVVGRCHNRPGSDTFQDALPESSDQRCLRERRGGRDQRDRLKHAEGDSQGPTH